MDEIVFFEYEDHNGEIIKISAEYCLKKTEDLLKHFDIRTNLINENEGKEALLAFASGDEEHKKYVSNKIEELKKILPHQKKSYLNLLSSIIVNILIIKYSSRLLYPEDRLAFIRDTYHLIVVLTDKINNIPLELDDEYDNQYKDDEKLYYLSWSLRPPKRIQGYALALIRALKFFNQKSPHNRPTAREILEYFRENVKNSPNEWPEIFKVNMNDLDFYTSQGDIATADLEALRKAINRYTDFKNKNRTNSGQIADRLVN